MQMGSTKDLLNSDIDVTMDFIHNSVADKEDIKVLADTVEDSKGLQRRLESFTSDLTNLVPDAEKQDLC